MKKPTKGDLLEHYAEKKPYPFVQFDFFSNVAKWDSVMHPDRDGDCVFKGPTYELMSGNSAVRILIRPDVSRKDALRGLSKIAGWIRKTKVLNEALKDFEHDSEREEDRPF